MEFGAVNSGGVAVTGQETKTPAVMRATPQPIIKDVEVGVNVPRIYLKMLKKTQIRSK